MGKKKSGCGTRRSRRLRKKSPLRQDSRKAAKRGFMKCPYCRGSGRVKKASGLGGRNTPRSYFPQFFAHVCKRFREMGVKQSGRVTMIMASNCWRCLSKKQKEEFIRSLDGGGGGGDGGGCSGCCGNGGDSSGGSETYKDYTPWTGQEDTGGGPTAVRSTVPWLTKSPIPQLTRSPNQQHTTPSFSRIPSGLSFP